MLFEKEVRKYNRKIIVDSCEEWVRDLFIGYKDEDIGEIVHIFHLFLFVLAVIFFVFFPCTRLFLICVFAIVILCNLYFHGCLVNVLELRFDRKFLMTDTVIEAFGMPVTNKTRYDSSIFFLMIALTTIMWIYLAKLDFRYF